MAKLATIELEDNAAFGGGLNTDDGSTEMQRNW